MTQEPKMTVTLRALLIMITLSAIPTSCVASPLSGQSTVSVGVGQKFTGSIREVPGGGHFILGAGERRYDVVLSDFAAPRAGEIGDDKFIEALNRIIYPPIYCEVDTVEPDAIYAQCYVENHISLSDLLRKWGVPERSKKE